MDTINNASEASERLREYWNDHKYKTRHWRAVGYGPETGPQGDSIWRPDIRIIETANKSREIDRAVAINESLGNYSLCRQFHIEFTPEVSI